MISNEQRTKMLRHIAEQAVPNTIDLWPSIRVRAGLPAARQPAVSRIGRRLAFGAGAAGLIAALVVGSVFWSTLPEPVSAETILDRAESVARGPSVVSTYHLLMTRQTAADKGSATITSEAWFGGPDRQRTTARSAGDNTAGPSVTDVVFNGPETWIVSSENGQTRVIHTIGTEWTRPADGPSSGANLADLLQSYRDKSCMVARRQADSTIAGQATYVIAASPTRFGCGANPSDGGIRVSGQVGGTRLEQASQLRVWVDQRTFLPLKMEVLDASGAVLDRSEVTSVEYNVAIPADVFSFSPPPGVPVSTFTGGNGADVKRAVYEGSGSQAVPSNKH